MKKKKFFSYMLMGLLAVGTTSTVISCKDYDDDINGLQTQIDNLNSLLKTIQTQVDKGAIISSVTPVSNGITLALSNGTSYTITNGVDGAKGEKGDKGDTGAAGKDGVNYTIGADGYWYADGVKTDYKAIGTDGVQGPKGDTGAAGKDGKDGATWTIGADGYWYLDGAKTTYKAIGKDGVDGTNGKDGVDGTNGKDGVDGTNGKDGVDGTNGKDGVDGTNGKDGVDGTNGVDGLNGDYYVPNASTGKFDKYTYDVAQKKYVSTPTDISFLAPGTITAVKDEDKLTFYGINGFGNEGYVIYLNATITQADLFLNNHENGASAFDDELTFTSVQEQTTNFGDLTETSKVLSFQNGKSYVEGDSVLVRVNPSSAVLKASNIKLVNSQNKEIDIVQCVGVHRYNGLATRATENNLWVVKFNLKDDFTQEDFNEAAKIEDGSILYAVSIKDDQVSDPDQRIRTDYDLTLTAQEGNHAGDFTVGYFQDYTKNTSVTKIHNRFMTAEDGTSTSNIQELVWKDNNKPATKENIVLADDDATKINTVNRPATNNDNRQNQKLLPVDLNKNIWITYPTDKPIKGFYVTLDNDYAVESAPSEINAWSNYKYENVGVKDRSGKVIEKATMFEGNKGSIKILDTNNADDIIGFRVYAVNLDGTLLDPDGRSFYVSLGNEADVKVLPEANITATNVKGEPIEDTQEIEVSDLKDGIISTWAIDGDPTTGLDGDTDEKGTEKVPAFKVKFFDADNNLLTANATTGVTELSKAVKAVVSFFHNDPSYYEDETPYTQRVNILKSNKQQNVIQVLTLTAKKVLPAAPKDFSDISGQLSSTNSYIWPIPDGTATNPTTGHVEMQNLFNGVAGNADYKFTFANGVMSGDPAQKLTVDKAQFVANNNDASNQQLTITYTYHNIRTYYDKDAKKWVRAADYEPVVINRNVKYANIYGEDVANMSWTEKFAKDYAKAEYGSPAFTINVVNINVTNSRDKNYKGTLDKMIDNGHYKITDAKLYSEGKTIEEYFNASVNADGKSITLTPTYTTDDHNPSTNVSSQLVLTVVDRYGIEHVYKFAFNVNKR